MNPQLWILVLGFGGYLAWNAYMNKPPSTLAPNYQRFWLAIRKASAKYGIPIPVLFGVLSRETGGQLINGDGGHGRGPWQIDDRYHQAWLATHDAMDIDASTDYAASLLKSNLDYFRGDLPAAVASYNASRARVTVADPDRYTTGGNYSRNVLDRAEQFAAQLGLNFVA